ncbi:GNAT family N-acetyltransferase [Holophaga foetida]|uniref:GNAT family N-acetyltransferase n=1 Tax=Holophaga foetida TaxID=35839 RepID=UPI0002474D1F|nr:hypothetical protein [Holophaga foetida]
MDLRRALPSDYSGVLELSVSYHAQSLSPAERSRGFLSARFSLEQITAMAEDLGIIVACDQGRVLGLLCASRFDWGDTPPIIRSMSATFDRVIFQGQPLSAQRKFLYGPVCIDLPFRGQGLLRRMFLRLNQELEGSFEVGVVFVAADNPHSMEVHTKGLGMQPVGEFTHAGLRYHILAYCPAQNDMAAEK